MSSFSKDGVQSAMSSASSVLVSQFMAKQSADNIKNLRTQLSSQESSGQQVEFNI